MLRTGTCIPFPVPYNNFSEAQFVRLPQKKLTAAVSAFRTYLPTHQKKSVAI